MAKIKTFFREHKRASFVILMVLALFVAGSAISAGNVAQRRAEAENAEEETVEEPAVALTESQQAAISEYDEETEDFISTLGANVWSANDGRYTLRFDSTSYTETANGEDTVHSYAILRLEVSTGTDGNDYATAVVETDTGTHILNYSYLSDSVADGSGSVTSSLSSSSMFLLADTAYERADAVERITVSGLDSATLALAGIDADELTDSLSEWCALHYPTATEAVWDGTAYFDQPNSLATLDFTLSGESSVSLSAIYHMDSGTYEFAT